MLQRVRIQTVETKNQPVETKKQITEKIVASMIAKKAEQYQEYHTDQIHRDELGAFEKAPTRRLQTTCSMQKLPRTTKQMLLLDKQGRPFTMVADSFLDTLTLMDQQVLRFFNSENRYPAEALLSPLRYLAKGNQFTHYVLPQFNISIPIRFDRSAYENFLFEVCVRGE